MIGSLIKPLLILWGVVTAAFLVVVVWKSLVGIKETDVVIADPLEDRVAEEQKVVISRVESLLAWAKGLGFASLALILLVGGLSIYWSLTAS
jgi:predicted methyltransferase